MRIVMLELCVFFLFWHPVFGIRDILVRIGILKSVPLTFGSGSIPYPTPFFIDFQNTKKNSYFFLSRYACGQVISQRKLNFLLKFCVNFYFAGTLFSQLDTFMEKGKDPEPDPQL
jgi:hypothetical protein